MKGCLIQETKTPGLWVIIIHLRYLDSRHGSPFHYSHL
jgi:hypothetical protein